MNTPIMWFLLANIGFAVLWCFYRLFLHRDTFFVGKRFTLLLGLMFTIIYPLVNVSNWISVLQPVQKLTQGFSMALPEITVTAHSTQTFSNWDIWTYIYLSIIGLFLCNVVFQFSKLLILAYRHKSKVVNGQKIICLPKGSAPFSFFGVIFIHPDDHSESDLYEILQHERTHVKQLHTLDVLFAEILCTIFWINPFVWLLKYDLRENLEFLADKDVVHAGFDPKSYQYHLLRLSYQQSPIRMGNNFNVSQLQNRIKMMNKKRSSQVACSKYFLTLPLFVTLLMVSYACKSKTEKDSKMNATIESASNDSTISTETDTVPPALLKSSKKFSAPNQKTPPPPPLKKTLKFTPPVISKGTDSVYQTAEQMPQFQGGDIGLVNYLSKNLHYPLASAEAGIEGRVILRFIVTKSGEVKHVTVVRGLNKECDEESIRVVKSMPAWKPGTSKGVAVDVYFTLPIVFKLQK
ncbi:MAG TPA: M56 family metallopeptidase [Bacteroidales bacterium]|nr:M56 family metallopeptidase [Bacteroidales bacterium]